MHRIDSSGAAAGNQFTEGDPQTQTPATVVSSAWLNDVQENISEAIEGSGVALVKGDSFQLEKAIISMSKKIGELVVMEIEEAPVTIAEARSNASPANPEYNPVIPRHDNDHDVSTTEAPDLVTKYRAQKLKVLGVSDFPCSVSGSRITLTSTTANDKLIAALTAVGLVNRWFSSGQAAAFEASGVDFAAAGRIYCLTVNGIEYPITAVSIASRYIDVSGSPAAAATCSLYPYRISGDATKVRLRRLSGFVPVAGGDADGEVLFAMARMDRFMNHYHSSSQYPASGAGPGLAVVPGSGSLGDNLGVLGPKSDGTATPRTGKTTDPRTYGVTVYTWARRLLAKTWTNP